jgi:hypothetical protein
MVAAVRGLASSRVPICRLEIPTMDPAFKDSNVDGERHPKTELLVAMSDLFEVRCIASSQQAADSCNGRAV